jgi:hypothetical protein
MAPLDFSTECSFECVDDNAGDLAFVHATSLIGSRDMIEEYLACGLFPASIGFSEITDGETLASKVTLPLPEFPLTKFRGESDDHFRVRVELDVENVVGTYSRPEHDACVLALLNGGRLNRVFKNMAPVRSLTPSQARRL